MEEYRIYPNIEEIKFKREKLFIKGPIPYIWYREASAIDGKTLHVAMILWMIAGMSKSSTFKLQLKFFRDCRISRITLYSSLKKLEENKLIKVEKSPGKTSIITILQITEFK